VSYFNLAKLSYPIAFTDFRIDAEWDFFATSHGKGPCDGLGGTVKRLAARASLQRTYDHQIMTPHQLYEWVSGNTPTIHFEFCTSEDYKRAEAFLQERFQKSRTIPGTQKLHCFVPLTKSHSVPNYIPTQAFKRKKGLH